MRRWRGWSVRRWRLNGWRFRGWRRWFNGGWLRRFSGMFRRFNRVWRWFGRVTTVTSVRDSEQAKEEEYHKGEVLFV
jgi:predicted DCC family thiol-disulfide oxidoreductase YuxK